METEKTTLMSRVMKTETEKTTPMSKVMKMGTRVRPRQWSQGLLTTSAT